MVVTLPAALLILALVETGARDGRGTCLRTAAPSSRSAWASWLADVVVLPPRGRSGRLRLHPGRAGADRGAGPVVLRRQAGVARGDLAVIYPHWDPGAAESL